MGSVPSEHLEDFDKKLQGSFKRIVRTGIDMERMAMVLNRDERQVSLGSRILLERYLYPLDSSAVNSNLPREILSPGPS